jgi:glycine/D-amino acid oxidase-like deaminating enzyme/nitrite reductase/ring-hydroxylating ferredoxin subunit
MRHGSFLGLYPGVADANGGYGSAMASYWLRTAPGAPRPSLVDDLSTDVTVVGGGIAGLSTAWEVARTGRAVVVLEAGRVAAGVTGHTTAKLTAAHGALYHKLPPQHARLYALSQMDAVDYVRSMAQLLDVDCEYEERDAYTCTEDPGRVEELRVEARAASQAGLDASYETDPPLGFAGAVRITGQAQFHPRKYLLALADAITEAGGKIFEQTRVVSLHEGNPHRVRAEQGATVQSGHVVVATHFPVFDRAVLFPRLIPRREFVLGFEIDADEDPMGMYLTIEDDTRSVRTAPLPDGKRLLIITGAPFTPGAGRVADRVGALRDWARERFGVKESTHLWAAQDNRSTDLVPFVGPLHVGAHGLWVATGFGGWGMSNGVMSGLLLAASINGLPLDWAGLYDPRRLHPIREAGALLRGAARSAQHLIADRLKPSDVGSVEEIEPGDGKVIVRGGRRCAVYRDDDGNLHSVSAACSHMGCVVGFNEVERTWECPCHGSRYGIDGSVLQGPAVKPLEKVEVQ